MVERIFPARPSIIRGKHATDEGNQGYPILAIVTYRIQIPPNIATIAAHGGSEIRAAEALIRRQLHH
jgi:hypothetical protein